MAIAFVNTTSGGDNSGTAQSSTVCTAASLTAGNCAVVGVAHTGGTITSITDTALNTYLPTGVSVTAAGNTVEIWYAANALGNASNVVTVHYSPTCTFPRVVVDQYSGIAASSPFDVGGTGHVVTGGSVSSAPLVTTAPNEVIVAFCSSSASATYTAGTGFTLRGTVVQTDTQSEDDIVSAIGSYTAAITVAPTTLEMWLAAASFSATPIGPAPFPATTMLPLTGLAIPGYPSTRSMLPTGVEPNALGYVTPLPISQFLNPLSLVMGPVLFPIPAPYVVPAAGSNQPITPDTGINATSSMTGSVTKLALVNPAAINDTSTVTGSVTKLALVRPAAITDTSALTGTVVALRAVLPASITSSSTLAATVTKLAQVRQAVIVSTSPVTATVSLLGGAAVQLEGDFAPIFVSISHL